MAKKNSKTKSIKDYSEALQKLEKHWRDPKLANSRQEWGEKICADVDENFTFEKFVAKGGEGVVIKSFDNQLHRPVAVKAALNRYNATGVRSVDVYEKEFQEDERNQFRIRFLRGASIQAEISHLLRDESSLGLVPFIFSSCDRPCWIVQEWMDGQDSLAWAQEQASLDLVFLFGWKLLRLLRKIHAFGIIHRDLKTSNVLVSSDGRPILIDLANGKDLRQTNDLTSSGVFFGSQTNICLELDSKHSTYVTDVYGAATTLWCLFRQRNPNSDDGNLLEQIRRNSKTKNWPLGGIVTQLRPVLKKALATIDDRYKTINAFLADYEEALLGMGISLPTEQVSGVSGGKVTITREDPTIGAESEEFTANIISKIAQVKKETDEIIRKNSTVDYSQFPWYPHFKKLAAEIAREEIEKRLNG